MVSKLTPLLLAGRAGHVGVCKRLILEGASIDAQDMFGDNIFHYLSRSGRGTTLQFIKEFAEKARTGSTAGLLQVKNNRGKTCLDIAANASVASIIHRELSADQRKQKPAGAAKLKRGPMKGVGGQVVSAQQTKSRKNPARKK